MSDKCGTLRSLRSLRLFTSPSSTGIVHVCNASGCGTGIMSRVTAFCAHPSRITVTSPLLTNHPPLPHSSFSLGFQYGTPLPGRQSEAVTVGARYSICTRCNRQGRLHTRTLWSLQLHRAVATHAHTVQHQHFHSGTKLHPAYVRNHESYSRRRAFTAGH